jgi:hypothetical protein
LCGRWNYLHRDRRPSPGITNPDTDANPDPDTDANPDPDTDPDPDADTARGHPFTDGGPQELQRLGQRANRGRHGEEQRNHRHDLVVGDDAVARAGSGLECQRECRERFAHHIEPLVEWRNQVRG